MPSSTMDEGERLSRETENNDTRSVADQAEQFPFDAELWEGQPLGIILREFRRAYGLSLHQVSEAIKVRSVYLDYLETGTYDKLPGKVYGSGFIKSYAAYLGLPEDHMIALYRQETAVMPKPVVAPAKQTQISNPFAQSINLQPIGMLVGSLIIALILLYLIFFLATRISFASSEGPSLSSRVTNFLFGQTEANVRNDGNVDTGLEENASEAERPIVIGTDGSVTVAAAPSNKPTNTAALRTDANGNLISDVRAGETRFLGTTLPIPRAKPDLSSAALEKTQVQRPSPAQARGTVDPNLPVISPRAVNVGQTNAFGTASFGNGVGFNLQAANVDAISLGVEPEAQAAIDELTQTPADPQANQANTPTQAQTNLDLNQTPQATQAAATPAAEPGDASRITIIAKDRTWVQVQNPAGQSLKSDFLTPGDVFSVPEGRGLRLVTGSLDALTLNVDGNAVKTPKSINSANETIVLDPNLF